MLALIRVCTVRSAGHLHTRMQYDDLKRVAKVDKTAIVKRTRVQKVVSLFSHLPQYERETSFSLKVINANIMRAHPTIFF